MSSDLKAASLKGRLDLERMPALLAQADVYASAGQLDLSGVERVDSAGISFLLELQRRARAAGKTLQLAHAPEQLTGLAHFFNVEEIIRLNA